MRPSYTRSQLHETYEALIYSKVMLHKASSRTGLSLTLLDYRPILNLREKVSLWGGRKNDGTIPSQLLECSKPLE